MALPLRKLLFFRLPLYVKKNLITKRVSQQHTFYKEYISLQNSPSQTGFHQNSVKVSPFSKDSRNVKHITTISSLILNYLIKYKINCKSHKWLDCLVWALCTITTTQKHHFDIYYVKRKAFINYAMHPDLKIMQG